VGVDLLLLTLTVFSALHLNLIVEGEEHLVTVFLVLDLLLPRHLRVLELQKLITSLE